MAHAYLTHLVVYWGYLQQGISSHISGDVVVIVIPAHDGEKPLRQGKIYILTMNAIFKRKTF